METLEHDNNTRIYGVYVPRSASPGGAPLVFLLHGGGGAAEKAFGTEFGRSWRALADRDGFIIIVPQGREDIGDAGSHHWNDCRTGILNPDVATDLDDVGFIATLVDLANTRFGIDRTKVYVTGASNGGMMSFRIAFEASDRFAAIGAVIANIPDPSECSLPTTPISVLIMNGTADPLIPNEGGCVANATCRRGSVVSTAESVDFWVRFDRTSITPIIEDLPNLVTSDNSTVTTSRYSNGLNGTEVLLYRVDGGGHNVPGNEPIGLARSQAVGAKNQDVNAAEEIWEFFRQHSR
ncbi:MAG: PHB depolymerase family esterase [Gemmatimonadota bacterium]|nr:MAG: PHB depolymerase family esterase [Gemmatimonadota bacterium]